MFLSFNLIFFIFLEVFVLLESLKPLLLLSLIFFKLVVLSLLIKLVFKLVVNIFDTLSLWIICASGISLSSPGRFLGISYKSLILTMELKFFRFSSCFSSM